MLTIVVVDDECSEVMLDGRTMVSAMHVDATSYFNKRAGGIDHKTAAVKILEEWYARNDDGPFPICVDVVYGAQPEQ